MSRDSLSTLITLEGIDGSGKTTLAHMLFDFLSSRGIPCSLTWEPTSLSFQGRELNLALMGERHLTPQQMAEYFVDDRRAHVERVIRPRCQDGEFVICDRYLMSTVVYQSAQGVDPQTLLDRQLDIPAPGLTLLLDLPVSKALDRLSRSRRKTSTMEKKELLERVRELYLKYCHGEEFAVLDAGLPTDEVFQSALVVIRKRYFPDGSL